MGAGQTARRTGVEGARGKQASAGNGESEENSGFEYWGEHVPYSSIEVGDIIGEGTFGRVYSCRCCGKKVAMKVMHLPENKKELAEAVADFSKEVRILIQLRHPSILHFLGAVNEHPHYCHITGSLCSLRFFSSVAFVLYVFWCRQCPPPARVRARVCGVQMPTYIHIRPK